MFGDENSDDKRDVEITSVMEFCEALDILLMDKEFPEENTKTTHFIEGMQAWLRAFDGRNTFFDNPNNQNITWSDLFKLIQASANYE